MMNVTRAREVRSAQVDPPGRLGGVIPVLATPFSSQGELDLASFERLSSHVLRTGVSAVMFPGFASEFYKLSGEERRVLLDVLLEQAADHPSVSVIASIAEHATALAVAEACRAVARGVSACNLLPPFLLSPPPHALRAHIGAVLEAVAPVPVIVQIVPGLTGTQIGVEDLRALADTHGNFRIVKVETSPPGRMVAALGSGTPVLSSLVGYGGVQLPDALRRGATGVQPGCSFTELYQLVWSRWSAGDEMGALTLHRSLLPYLSYWMQQVELLIAAEKLIALRRGLIGSACCRSPAWQLDDQEVAAIDRFVEEFSPLWGRAG